MRKIDKKVEDEILSLTENGHSSREIAQRLEHNGYNVLK